MTKLSIRRQGEDGGGLPSCLQSGNHFAKRYPLELGDSDFDGEQSTHGGTVRKGRRGIGIHHHIDPGVCATPIRGASCGARFSGRCRTVCVARHTLCVLCIASVSREGAIPLIPSRRGSEAVVADGRALAARERHVHISFHGTGFRVFCSLGADHTGCLALLIRRMVGGRVVREGRCAADG